MTTLRRSAPLFAPRVSSRAVGMTRPIPKRPRVARIRQGSMASIVHESVGPHRSPGNLGQLALQSTKRPGPARQPRAGELLSRPEDRGVESLAAQGANRRLALDPVPDRGEHRLVEHLQLLAQLLARHSALEQEAGALGIALDPTQVVPDECPDPTLCIGRAFQGAQDAGLVPAQDLRIERGLDPVLAAEVVIDRADARAGAPANVLDSGCAGGAK